MNASKLNAMAGIIRMERVVQNKTVRMLAEESGLSIGTISAVESGCVDPKMTTLMRLMEALNIRPERIFGREWKS